MPETGYASVQSPVNITGLLFNKTDTRTPLFNRIGNTNVGARQFITGAWHETGYPTAPAEGISEDASRTAPDPEFWTRENASNITQIFQRTVDVTYRKMANGADLTNYLDPLSQQPSLVGNTNNVPSELAFQLSNATAAMRMDIENIILNGVFLDGEGDPTKPDQTRGLLDATVSNVLDANGDELNYTMLYDIARLISEDIGSNFDLSSYLAILNHEQFKQLQKIAANEGIKIDYTTGGVNVASVLTPYGTMRFMPHRFIENGTMEVACMPILGNVLQPTPGKGNFFYEALAKKGAAEQGQIFGMWGLDHGNEYMHVKLEGIAETTEAFTAPQVYVANMPAVTPEP